MQTDVRSLIPLAELAASVPPRSDGKPLTVDAIRRWASRGVRGVKLEVVKVGGRLMVEPSALRNFIQATTAAYKDE